MSETSNKRRTSILKKRRSNDDEEATATINTKMQRKLMFSQKKEIIEFVQCEQNVTIWGNKYETSVARSETNSTDSGGASTSQHASIDFNSMHASSHITATSISIEADKENCFSIVEKEAVPIEQSYTARVSDEPSVPEMSIFINSEERTKMKDCSPANLNITNMPLDASVLAANKLVQNVMQSETCSKVLSPRKTVFLNKDFAVTVQDKVFLSPQAAEERFSLSLLENEENQNAASEIRKVIMNPDTPTRQSNVFFKCPDLPKDFKFRKSMGSPPIKPGHGINKQEIEDMYDIITQDTPSKNLCCLTPQRSASKAQAMSKVRKSDLLLYEFGLSESKSDPAIEDKSSINISSLKMDFTNDDDGTFETTDELAKKAARLLKNPNATLRTLARPSGSPLSSASSTLTLDESINLSKPVGLARSTTYALEEMSMHNDQGLEMFNGSAIEKPRVTAYNQNMSMNTCGDDVTKNKPQNSRNTVFNHDMSMNEPPKNLETLRKSLSRQFDAADESLEVPHVTEPRKNERITIFHDSMIEDEPKVQEIPKSRATTFDLKKMDDSTQEKLPPISQKRNRETIYGATSLDESENQESFSGFKLKQRHTVFDQNEILESPLSEKIEVKPSQKGRATTFQHNEMNLSVKEVPSFQFVPKQTRTTTFQLNEMDHSSEGSSSMPKSDSNARVTTFQLNEIDRSGTSSSTMPKSVPKARATTFQLNELDHSSEGTSSMPKSILKGRTTTFEQQEIDASINETTGSLPKNYFQNISHKNRATPFEQQEIDASINLSANEVTASLSKNFSQNVNRKARATTFEQQEIDASINETTCALPKNLSQYVHRPSVLDSSAQVDKSILRDIPRNSNISCNLLTIEQPQMAFEEQELTQHFDKSLLQKSRIESIEKTENELQKVPSRLTSYVNQDVEESYHEAPSNLMPKVSNRQTTFQQEEMNDSNENVKPRKTVGRVEMNCSGIEKVTKEDDDKIMVDEVFTPPAAFKSLRSEEKRKSVIVQPNEPCTSKSVPRKTSYEHEDMETNENERRKTFTVKANDSMKWHDVTDADLNLIDDESNPCVEDQSSVETPSSQNTEKIRASLGSISRYEDALDDFVNLTIVASPLNMTGNAEVPPAQSKRVSMPILPNRNYENMFDDLLCKLKKKNEPKPRLAIDDYLEKLQIAPVKIQRRPDLEPNAIMDRINAKKEELRQRREDKKAIEQNRNAMLPEIPDAGFLMTNFFKSMEEEIRHQAEREVIIQPIFPEAMSFEYLLKNKFDTDEHLQKYWKLDTTFWWKKNFWLTHKELVFFTISINSQQTASEADDSTIPILFAKSILIIGPTFRYDFEWPKKWGIMKKEFKNAINGISNFNSMCRSSNELLSFLDYYHTNVMKVVEIVDTFKKIIGKYKGILKQDKKTNIYFARKMNFLKPDEEGFVEAQDVVIPINSFIANISIQDVSVTGKLFEYALRPTAYTSSLSGLMLLEYILLDVGKFVETNFEARKIIYG